jgi:hypothetical protein
MDLKELKRLASEATPGPWWVERPENRDAEICFGTKGDSSDTYDLIERYGVDTDYEYIAAANPDTILALIERVEQEHKKLTLAKLAFRHIVEVSIDPEVCHTVVEVLKQLVKGD